jgi:enediyne biosynthesis protein E3
MADPSPPVSRISDSVLAPIREYLFAIDVSEASFARRGFGPTPLARQQRLEEIGRCFVAGYNAAVRTADPVAVVTDLSVTADELSSFAFEGAAMGFALLDLLAPWRSRRLALFLSGAAGPHVYMGYVGAGWALARTSLLLAWRLGNLDPLLRWLMFDGYGFHEGYFHPTTAIVDQCVPRGLRGHARSIFDQGLGRAIWFATGAQGAAAAGEIGKFPPARHSDLWSGIGLAAAYAGGVEKNELTALAKASGPHYGELGQGAAFAAKARQRAGNPAAHTELACQTFCGIGAAEAATITDEARPLVSQSDRGEAYLAWRAEIRRRIGAHFSSPLRNDHIVSP